VRRATTRRAARWALAALGALALRDGGIGSPLAAPKKPIKLSGIGAYDPEGGDGEHDDDAYKATDQDPSSYWTTEEYNDFANTKKGVGVVLDAGKQVEPGRMIISTDTPGYTAEIRQGTSATGPFEKRVGSGQVVTARTTFHLDDAKARYFLVWITALDRSAHVNDVRAR